MGSIKVLCGPMFSGKTERLLELVRAEEAIGLRVAVLKPSLDSRTPREVVSHRGTRHVAVEFHDPKSLLAAAVDRDVVAIDEVQFVDQRTTEAILRCARRCSSVIAAGLDYDFRSEPFPSTSDLISSAAEVHHLTGTCTTCGRPSSLTQRVIGGIPAPLDGPTILLDDAMYEPRCAECYWRERATLADEVQRPR